MLCTLNLHNVTCQLQLNEPGERKTIRSLSKQISEKLSERFDLMENCNKNWRKKLVESVKR